MSYDLMLLADPGTDRSHILNTLGTAPDVRADGELDSRFWLTTSAGEAQINIGTKDPVESVHLEFELGSVPLMEAVAARALDLAEQLDMRVEDVQWGHEVTRENLPRLKAHWQAKREGEPPGAGEARPWWRFW